MTYRSVGLGLGLLFLGFQISCSDDATPPFTPGGGGGGGGNALCQDEGGPAVNILQPTPAADLTAASIITEPSVLVQCQVDSTGDPVDDSSVVIRVVSGDGEVASPAVANRGDGLFEATADISSFSNGALQVTCEASNAGPRGPCTGAGVDTYLDLGPDIVMLFPSSSGSVLSGGMTVRYVISLAPVSEDDTTLSLLADIPQTVVAGQSIVTELEPGSQDTFVAEVSFDDPLLYETPLDGTYQLLVSATNQRGVTRTETLDFTVDAEGPTITIDEPELGSVIGGATDVVATVNDASGIDPTQVSFYIGSDKFDMEPVAGSATRFRGTFDANQYETSIGEVLIDVVAVDSVGNEHVASVTVELDNVPPHMSLDPQLVREGKRNMGALECSIAFDPVGANAVSDGDVIDPISFIRARVEDRGNPSASFKSGLDDQSVQVWILGRSDQALVINNDADPDGICDTLNPDFLPGNVAGNTPAVELDLVSIAPTGSADYLSSATFPGYPFCQAGNQDVPAEPVCSTTTIPRVIPDNRESSGAIPAIFVKPPVIPIYCMGDPFDWQTSLNSIEGPGCMVVTAKDELGNSNVSQPIRVCFSSVYVNPAAPDLTLPPGHPCRGFNPSYTCTDGCTAERFPDNELIGPFGN